MSDSDNEIMALINDVSVLATDVSNSLKTAKSIKMKTASFESNLGLPLCLKEPLCSSFKHAGDSINELRSKIKTCAEEGNLTEAVALQSVIIAKLYLNKMDQEAVEAISDLADIYYQNMVYEQASVHSVALLKQISIMEQNKELIKSKSCFMIAKQMIIQKKYEKANEYLRMGRKNSPDQLKGMYYRIKAELNDAQEFYLSAIESYQTLVDNKLYKDETDHVEILIRIHRLYKSSCELDKSLVILEKADAVNNSAKPRNMLLFLRLKLILINTLEPMDRALNIAECTLNEIKNVELTREEKNRELLIRVCFFL